MRDTQFGRPRRARGGALAVGITGLVLLSLYSGCGDLGKLSSSSNPEGFATDVGGPPAFVADFRAGALAATVGGQPRPDLILFNRADAGMPRATYLDVDGRVMTAAPGAPRFEWDPSRCADPSQSINLNPSCPRKPLGLLLERPSRNLVIHSHNFAPWTATPNVTVSVADVMGPDGITAATRVQMQAVAQTSVGLPIAAAAGEVLTFSVWARANADPDFSLMIEGTNSGLAEFQLTNEWRRYSVTGTVTDPTGLRVVLQNDIGGQQVTADFFVWGAQAEVGAVATSLIFTQGASVERAGDEVRITNLDWLRSRHATWVVRWQRRSEETFGGELLNWVGGTVGTQQWLGRSSLGNTRFESVVGMNVTSISGGLNWGLFQERSSVVTWSGSGIWLYEAGQQVASGPAPAVPTSYSVLRLGGAEGVANRFLSGHIQSVRYYPRRASDAELTLWSLEN